MGQLALMAMNRRVQKRMWVQLTQMMTLMLQIVWQPEIRLQSGWQSMIHSQILSQALKEWELRTL